MKIKRMVLTALLLASALIMSYIELLLPIPLPIPGIKIGLANIVIIFALYRLNFGSSALISVLRVVIISLLFSNVVGFIYSITGALLSLTAMYVLKKLDLFSIAVTGICGAITHNIAQIGVAIIIMGTKQIIFYLPMLILWALISGAIIGLIGDLLIKKLPN